MKIFTLRTTANGGGDIITLRDNTNRLSGYFISNRNDGKFLQHVKLQAEAQENLPSVEILKSDFLQATIGIPLFSQKARDVFTREIPEALEFHLIEIRADGHTHAFYLAKVMMSADIIDGDKSTYLTLSGGVRLIDVVVCHSTFDSEFYIARDRDHPAYLVVSEKFVKLCADNNLSIDFADTTQS